MYAYPDGVASVLIGMFNKKKVIVRVMGCDINLFTRYFWRRKIIAWALKKAFHIISVSKVMKQKLLELGVPAEKISVIYNGVDQAIFKPMLQKDARQYLNILPDEKNILFVGSLEKVKGIETLLKAFALILQQGKTEEAVYRLYIIGNGRLHDKINNQIKSLRIHNYVKLLGNCDSAEIALWMNACDVLCLPSIREGLPNVLLEAMACNRPIVATRVGGIPELLHNYDIGHLVQPYEVKDLSVKLYEVLKTPKTESYRNVLREFSWERFSSEVNCIFESTTKVTLSHDRK